MPPKGSPLSPRRFGNLRALAEGKENSKILIPVPQTAPILDVPVPIEGALSTVFNVGVGRRSRLPEA